MTDDQTRLIKALGRPDAWTHSTEGIRVVETHISYVILTGRFAYKIKKALKLDFLDFSTLELRERFCRDELRLNRRFAPEVYLDVVPIGGTCDRPRVGATPALEFAVRMRQFSDDATADRLLAQGSLDDDDLTAFADCIADFHNGIEPTAADSARRPILENLEELESAPGHAYARHGRIGRLLRERVESLAPDFARRRESGAIRECHGDLHLGNVARIDGRLVPFDCLEFDRDLRTIDVIDEIAFLFMDLTAHGRPDLGYAFVNRYLEVTGDYPGLKLLHLYSAHRALIRAKVAAIARHEGVEAAADHGAGLYLRQAGRSLEPGTPRLLITSGLSGSGKTFVGHEIITALPAIRIRSDVERKRLHGLGALDRADAGIDEGLYGPSASAATYDRLETAAAAALAGGIDLIVDASFLERARRDRFRELAAHAGAHFLILRCEASAETLRRRIRERAAGRRDASDATEAVLEHQLETADPIGPDEPVLRIDTEGRVDIRTLANAIRADR